VTTDKNIRHQQNLKARNIALVVLEHSQWPMVKRGGKHRFNRQCGATRQLRRSGSTV
jgi:hypothetical protein